ncbi:hypothetical protein ACFV1W_30280 [Kitasatospora sp. NPDC059648]|uniref:hypothetical protein n=1 Tax=Kitasatospora sp. NPDC059648 TaxID=3346894 RepID=UPI00367E7E1F
MQLPAHGRIVVPVLSAVGGSGRSTTAGLIAAALAPSGSGVVLDLAPRLASPWPAWSPESAPGLASLPPHLPLTRQQVQQAAAAFPAAGGQWAVLTDHQSWQAPVLDLPDAPAAWYQLAAIGGWQTVVADTAYPVAHDVLSARHAGRSGTTAAWCSLPFSVPVLVAAATGSGMHALQTAVMAASAEGLPLARMVVAVICTGDGRPPPAVRAGETMLEPRVAAVVRVPFDSQLRAGGLREASRLGARTLQAAAELGRAVLDSARTSWGDPLPPAPVPAPYSPVPSDQHNLNEVAPV